MQGTLRKMNSELLETVKYSLKFNSEIIEMNEKIGQSIKLQWSGNIFCVNCNKKTKNSFGDGFCYPCFTTNANASPCIIRPELCRAHLGEGRDPEWEEKNHNQTHVVYLTASDIIKVGVTRSTNLPARWIDQGARNAIILAETPNRYEAGRLEVEMKAFFADKTNWRKMLCDIYDDTLDLENEKWELHDKLPSDLTEYFSENDEIFQITYPVTKFPESVSSIDLKKSPIVDEILIGIKGQYLIFESGKVFNVRRHSGFEVVFE